MNKLMLLVVVLTMTAISCKDKDGTSPNGSGISDAQKANLFDKVWYATAAGGGIDLEFLSSGVFRQAQSLEGTWSWQNGGDTMNVKDYNGKRFNYLFDEITATQITFRSNVGGDNYKTVAVYRNTK